MPAEAAPASHFRILDDIARDLSGDTNFPTCMDAAILVRNTLRDPSSSLERVVQVVGVEPLISSKLMRLANSLSYNPGGDTIRDLANAVSRLGFDVVRTTSLAVALDQMLKSRQLMAYAELARDTWAHCIHVAAIARVLARRLGRINPDEAMLAGLIHNIGVFYLLYRAADYPEYRDEAQVIHLLTRHQASIGESLLHLLGLPEWIVEAVRDQEGLSDVSTPCCIADILYFARMLSPAGPLDPLQPSDAQCQARERFDDLLHEAENDIHELRAALAA